MVDEWDGIPIHYYVPLGREEDGARDLQEHAGHDAAVLSEATGVRYPYAKYSQVVVQDFIFGGMENISATTLTDTALLDDRAPARRRRRRADRPRAGAPVVRRPAHLPRLVARLAQRGLRDLLRARSTREHNKGRTSSSTTCAARCDSYLGEARPLPAADRHQRLQRADRPLRPPPLRKGRHRPPHAPRASWARRCSGRRSAATSQRARSTNVVTTATCSAPSKRRPGATSTGSSTSGSTAPATPS